jgi:hypothetical protein
MNQVSGKVMLKGTNVGIPDVLVEVYDVDPNTKPEELISLDPATGIEVNPAVAGRVSLSPLLGERLLSIATDDKGDSGASSPTPTFGYVLHRSSGPTCC